MKMKRFIAGLLSLIMVISMTGVVDVNAAETTESTLLAENLTDGTYTDVSADPNEDYVYTVVGSDGSVAEISTTTTENVEEAYEKVTWTQGEFTSDTIENGVYLIVGSRSGYHLNKAIRAEAACQYEEVNPTNDVIVEDMSACEWTIEKNDDGTYKIMTTASVETDTKQYLTIVKVSNSGSASDPAVTVGTAETKFAISTTHPNNGTSSDAICGNTVFIGSSAGLSSGYLNANGTEYAGTWNGGCDAGSCFYLYKKGYKLTDDVIAEAIANVGYFTDYTEDSWNAYEIALEEAKMIYETPAAAEGKLTELNNAISELDGDAWAGKVGQSYVRLTPDTDVDVLTKVKDGIYAIVGAHYDNNQRYSQNKVILNDGTFNYDDLGDGPGTAGASNIVEDVPINELYEWEFKKTSDTTNIYSVQSVSKGTYMSITSSGATLQTNPADIKLRVDERSDAKYNAYGGIIIGNSDNNVLNHQSDKAGVWNYQDANSTQGDNNGSAYYLFQKQFTVLEDVITADVQDESVYTEASWSDYQTELAAIKDTYLSLEEAAAAVAELEKAVNNLEKIDESVLEACYVRLVPGDGSSVLTKVEDGIYAIVGAHYDAQYGGRQSQNKVIKNDGTFTYDDLGNGPGTAGDNNVYETFSENELYEWEFKSTSDTNIYSVQSVSKKTYMSITSSEATLQTDPAGIKLMVDERSDAKYNTYGGIIIGNSNNNVLNHQSNKAGVWSYQSTSSSYDNNGSVYYLFQKQYTVSADVIAEIKALNVDSAYPIDAITEYQDALAAAEAVKGTASEAYEAYKALVDAVNNLSEVILPATTISGTYEDGPRWTVTDGTAQVELTLDGAALAKTDEAIKFDLTTATGFELLASCGSNTGMLMAVVKNSDDTTARAYLVDTYYSGQDAQLASTKVPVVRDMASPEGGYVEVYGCLVASVLNSRAYSMRSAANTVSTEDIVLAALQELGLDDELSVSDVTVSYMDESSVLNGGMAQGAATYAVSLADTTETTSTTGDVIVEGCRVYREGNGVTYTAVSDLVTGGKAAFITEGENGFELTEYQKTGPQNEIYLDAGESLVIGLDTAPSDTYEIRVKVGSDESYQELTFDEENYTETITNSGTDTMALSIIRKTSTGSEVSTAMFMMSSEQTDTVLARLNASDILEKLNPFVDVEKVAYYYDAVLWAVEEQITDGWTDTLFAPDMGCTRGQVVTFLWRAAGMPEVTGVENPFTDVTEDAYYYDAVLWAVKNGITDGWTDTLFAPEKECTRGEIVTFLWRAAGEPEAVKEVAAFVDLQANAFYEEAVLWAVENGITEGVDETHFEPENTCLRGQIVTFLYRAMSENK